MTIMPSISNAVIHQLPNGLTLAMERLPYLHSASMGIWIKTGSALEQPHEAGLAHFLEHLFFKGTTTRNVHDIMATIESRGGQMNAFTSREYTCLYVRILDEHISTGIEILADILKNSQFFDLEKERNVILEEIASIEDSPDEYVFDLLSQHHWPDHALGRPVSGFAASVAALGMEDVKRFYQTWYKPGNMYFAIAGNFDEEKVLEQLTRELGDIPSGDVPPEYEPPVFSGGIHLEDRDIGQDHLCMAFPGPEIASSERYAYNLLINVLGGGSTSRLFEKIREEAGLAYAIYAFDAFYKKTGVMGVYAAVAPHNAQRTVDMIFEELRNVRDEILPVEEVDMSREQIKGHMLMAMESTFTRMNRLAKSLIYHDRLVPVEELIESLDAVTPDDIQASAQRYFLPKTCTLTILGPKSPCEGIQIAL